MDVENLAKELILKNMTPEQQMAVLDSVRQSVLQAKEVQKKKIGENVDLVVQALKKIESDIRSRFDDVGNSIEKRVASIQDGRDGADGKDGRDGKDGKNGRDGAKGDRGERGQDGVDGVDGNDGVSVSNARIDFDGSLIITLSSGIELNVGEVVAPDLAERIKVITNGGGTSQSVLDTLASLQTQITNLIPSQTGNSGKFLTTNGTALSWSSVAGGLSYQGTWNANTNTPTLTSSVGVNGYYYIVATAGSTNLNGITDWQIGDWLMFNGSVWQKIDQSNLVTSVNGQTGAVSVGTVTSVAATAGTGISVSGSPITTTGTLTITNTAPDQTVVLTAGTGINTSGTYPSFTITNSAPDQTVALTQGGTTTITGTYPNFTISSADQFQGTVTSVSGTSPVASSGGATPAISLEANYGDTQNPYASKTANYVLAAPNGSAGAPTFRAVVAADIPTLNQNTTGSAATLTTGRTIAITGDLAYTSPSFDGSANVTAAGTLATVNSNVGSFTAANITVNAKGLITAASSGTAGASISNDTSTSTNLYPLFANATSGTPTTIYTGDAKLLYKPSTGELQSTVIVASNGIVVNSQTVSADYTIAAGNNGMSAGTVSVNSGVTVTIATGSVWTVI
jgi:hypothetical protein